MNRGTLLFALFALAGCGDGYPAGEFGSGGGGPGGSGGVDAEPPVEIHFAGVDLEVRSQLFAPIYAGDGLLPWGYALFLLEAPRACESDEGLRVGQGHGMIYGTIAAPALGDCPIDTQRVRTPDEPEPAGCHAYLEALWDGLAELRTVGGSVRVERLDAGTLAGTVRVLSTTVPVETQSCSWGSGADGFLGSCHCRGPDGPFNCESTNEADIDCCDDELPVEEVTFAFETSRCAAAGSCRTLPCAPFLVGACQPEVAPPASCEAACAAYASTCASCVGCAGAGCEAQRLCDPAACLERCRGLAIADPLVALSLSCVQSAPTCDAWASCVSACGAP